MTLKYLVLALLAIQAVNASAIKTKSIETDFNELIAQLNTIASNCTALVEQLVEEFDHASLEAHDNAQYMTAAGIFISKRIEDLVLEDSPWAEVCFEPVQEEVSQINADLMAHTDKCLSDSDNATKHYLAEAEVYIRAEEIVRSQWLYCEHDPKCEELLLEEATTNMPAFTEKFHDFAGRIEAYIANDFAELTACLRNEVFMVYVRDGFTISYRIGSCMQEIDPNLE